MSPARCAHRGLSRLASSSLRSWCAFTRSCLRAAGLEELALCRARDGLEVVPRSQSKKLHPLDEAGGLLGSRIQIQRGVVVAHAEGDLDRLWIDEIHAAGQGDSGHSGGGWGEGAERAREVLHIFSTLDVVDV